MLAFLVPTATMAAPLDLSADVSVGSGVSLAGAEGETAADRSPLYTDLDVAVRLDGDTSVEWGLGITLQLEHATAVALTPRVRLIRGDRVKSFVGVGVPAFLTPFTLFGGEIGGGALYPINEWMALLAALKIDVFFAGSDLPEGQTLVMFNLGAGARVEF